MKYLKIFEAFNYNLKVFTQSEFTDFYVENYGYDYNLRDRIEYFSYDDLSHIFGNDDYHKSLRFVVAYNDKDILGIAKYAYYSVQDNYGVSFVSTNNSFFGRGISKNLLEEMVRYFSEHNKGETLGMSEYTIEGWHSLRHNFRKFAKKYGVKVKEQKIGHKIKTDDDLDLYNQSKKEIQELYPGTYPEIKLQNENKKSVMKKEEAIKLIKEDLTYGESDVCTHCDGKGYHYNEVTDEETDCETCQGEGEIINVDKNWKAFIDSQELGDCQTIVSSVKNLKIPGIETHFGEIEIVNFPTDEDYYGKIMTHHWVTYLGEVLEFSKGTLTEYINWNDLYDVNDGGEVDYSRQIMIKENKQTPELASGKAAFKIFLKIINSNDNLFSTNNYLNKGKYLYFFYTDTIQINEDVIDELEVRTSLETAYKTIYKLKDKRLSFFFAIDEFKLFYGFYDDTTHLIYKVGKYNVHDSDLRNLPDLDCLKKVNDVLIPDVDIKKRRFLNEIKEDFKKLFPKTDSKIEVVSSTVVKKEMELSKFKEEDQDYNAMAVTLDRFAEDFEWYEKVHTYIEIDEQDIIFYIKVV